MGVLGKKQPKYKSQTVVVLSVLSFAALYVLSFACTNLLTCLMLVQTLFVPYQYGFFKSLRYPKLFSSNFYKLSFHLINYFHSHLVNPPYIYIYISMSFACHDFASLYVYVCVDTNNVKTISRWNQSLYICITFAVITIV